MNRRLFLQLGSFCTLTGALSTARVACANPAATKITARKGSVHIVGPDFPATAVWGFDGQVPGTPIHVTQGHLLDVMVHNALNQPTAVHWHGIRLPNAMDGVAGLTQPAIQPGESFRYSFTPPDAGYLLVPLSCERL